MHLNTLARIIYKTSAGEKELVFEPTGGIINEDLEIRSEKTVLITAGLLKMMLYPKQKIKVMKFELEFSHKYAVTEKIFCNGYQSWTDSREFSTWEKMENISAFLHEMTSKSGDYTFYPYSERKGDLHGFTYTYIKGETNTLIFYGSLNERCGYTIFQHEVSQNRFRVIKDIATLEYSEPALLIDLFASTDREERVFEHYWRSWEILSRRREPITGWTSWYLHYGHITPEIIYQNLEHFHTQNIPIDVFQIDDGYQKATGDWLNTNSKFPDGMKAIAEAIHLKGFKAGLWLAPLVCVKDSFIFGEHPDWIFNPDGEHPQQAGYNPLWGGWYYALDFYNPEVKAYLKKVFDTVLYDWGFDMVKLDFLFAPALTPKGNKSRGQVMCEAMDLLRELCGDKFVLGCGVPLGPAFGKVDYCRIGNDISLNWETKWMKNLHIRERISTESTLNNSIARRHQNGKVFFNDPDVFILREQKNQLSPKQRKTLFIINHLFGGLVFTSDDISRYDSQTLNLYRKAFPHRTKEIQEVKNRYPLFVFQFSIPSKEYVGFSNFSKKAIQTDLEPGLYFEDDTIVKHESGKIELGAFQTRIFLKIRIKPGYFIGSTLHIFPGCEVEDWAINGSTINYKLHKNNAAKGTIYIGGGKEDFLLVNGVKIPVLEAGGERFGMVEV